MATSGDTSDGAVLNSLARELLDERKKTRKWRVFFRCLLFFYLGVLLLWLIFGSGGSGNKVAGVAGDHLALIPFNGVISTETDVNAVEMNRLLERAFSNHRARAVILDINSPGGSPVQSEAIYRKIRDLRAEYPDKKIYAVVSDVCASGSYYVAAATDAIYAAKASIVGSIGVRMDSYGLTELMQKIGVENRTITAGENKALYSPFEEVNPQDVEHLKQLLNEVHQQFIDDVKTGRGDRLKDQPQLYSGLFWSGETAVELGLVDGIGGAEFVAEEFYDGLDLVRYEAPKSVFEQLTEDVSAGVARAALRVVEARVAQPSGLH